MTLIFNRESDMKKLLNAQQVADTLGISKMTVCTYCQKGILPAFQLEKLWKIEEDDLIQFIAERKNTLLKTDPLFGVPLTPEEEKEYHKKLDAAEDITEQVRIHASVAHRKIQKPVVAANFDPPIKNYCPSPSEFAELSGIADDEERFERYAEISKGNKILW